MTDAKPDVQDSEAGAKPARVSPRSGARLAVVQALYDMDISGKGVLDALAEFEAHWIGREVDGIEHPPAETAFFRDLLRGTVEEQRAIDPQLDRALTQGWPLRRIEAVLRAILRAGAYELMFRTDVPARAAISEYVDVAHSFYSADEPGLVNAVLDRVARQVRPDEVGGQKSAPQKPTPQKPATQKPAAKGA
ncbi:transcription antitermination factor NusB [Methylobacterium sp. NEAU 140]|uniref:transcription antitermination factor NusB n=1 Tax=Methylobacterium sp. NEAU 140 TaxID=3064945 RepID=UPI0027376EF1|nr:transcription antitermination factor NusB [Methylobacterium sp. NEAU 140]MDP4023615.1 transcription antitermination factor NusB [Methylobacterium sp. NEAU 140]